MLRRINRTRPQLRPVLPGHRALHVLFVYIAILFSFISTSHAISFPWRLAQRATGSIDPTASIVASTSTSTIAFSSALAVESHVSAQLSQLASVPPIPLPTTIDNYKTWTQVASLMPPLQTNNVKADTMEMVAAVRDAIKTESDSGATIQSLAGRDAALRVMIVGDSMTQGQEGDYTWRYRIWEWFASQGVAVDFVGPYTGTVQPDSPSAPALPPLYGSKAVPGQPKTSGGYAAGVPSSFDRDHFAVWGRAAAVDKGLIYDVLSAHSAELMLLMLGFNDMGWFYSDAAGTLDSIHTLVTNARAVNPNLKFAIANVPQRSFIGGRDDLPISTNIYNALLRNAIPTWSTADSPIHLVELQENYDCEPSGCPAGYDGLHPTATGEFQIARAFSLTLVNDFKIGSSPLSIPGSIPGRSLPVPTNFKVFSSATGVTATWDPGKRPLLSSLLLAALPNNH